VSKLIVDMKKNKEEAVHLVITRILIAQSALSTCDCLDLPFVIFKYYFGTDLAIIRVTSLFFDFSFNDFYPTV